MTTRRLTMAQAISQVKKQAVTSSAAPAANRMTGIRGGPPTTPMATPPRVPAVGDGRM